MGLGFVGLPLAIQFWRSGLCVTGIDTDRDKLDRLRQGKSYLCDVADADIARMRSSGRFACTEDAGAAAAADAILVCVPTPLREDGEPDLRFILQACASLQPHVRPGQLVVLESSTFPGTTDEWVVPILEATGMKADVDFYVAYSPERMDPGSHVQLARIPKLVGGVGPASLRKAVALYAQAFTTVVPVSSARVAEMAKLLENTQRFLNISLMNELAMVCHRAGIDVWEVIRAAATKPYGFSVYLPGPGAGGHCIPVDPVYLEWFAAQQGLPLRAVRWAREVNARMPRYVAERAWAAANKDMPRVLLCGVTYKRDVNDTRESAALRVMEELLRMGAKVAYTDPYVPHVVVAGRRFESVALTEDVVQAHDIVVILTDHACIDYRWLADQSRLVLDTRGVYQGADHPRVVRL